ncbi:NAD(P)-binding protein [Auricularia subglabra TFB-10046 SS5]|nr:NAD(P)-binding protein [Auricularia subglabra TFB-10046 SS5]
MVKGPSGPWDTDYTDVYHHSVYPAISPRRPEVSVAGKTIVISGGGKGLGTGIVDAFAQAGAANIVVTGRNVGSLEAIKARIETSYASTKVAFVAGDVSREEDVARVFAAAKQVAPGGIDVFIANAGYMASPVPISESKTDDWWYAYEVNVKGVFLQARYFLAAAAPNAAFFNISAGAAHLAPPIHGFSAYASSKLGAARVVETLQLENPALRFFNIQPGVVKTEMLTKSGFEAYNPPMDDHDLAGHFIVWLNSPEGEFLKGKFLWVNWDVDELKARKEEILSGNKLVTGLTGWV